EVSNGVDKLTDSEKKLIEVRNSPDWAKATPQQREELEARLKNAAAMEKYRDLTEEVAKAKREAEQQNARELQTLDQQLDALEKQVKFYGQSEAAVTAASIAEMEYQKSLVLANSEIIDPAVLKAYDDRI